jgi:hypothetical protein
VFTIAFTIEAILKIVAFGFKPYMSFFQNIIDILIVVSSLVMLVLDNVADLSIVKVWLVPPLARFRHQHQHLVGCQQLVMPMMATVAARHLCWWL